MIAAEADCQACWFDYQPGAYTDPSWLVPLDDGVLLARLRQTPRAQPYLSRHLVRIMQLRAAPAWRSENDPLGLALLPPEALQRIVLKAGACPVATHLRALVSGPQLRRLLNDIGADVYRFAVQQGVELAQRHRLATYELMDASCYGGAVRTGAMAALAAATESMDWQVTRRMLLKLPRRWSTDFRLLPHGIASDTARALLNDILQEESHAPRDS